MEYGQEIDFLKPFFEQFGELLQKVPHQGQFVIGGTMENSDYVNCAGYLKDCYLIAETDHNEHCYYGNRLFFNSYLVDCSNCYEDQWCYECVDCIGCHNLRFSEDCQRCSDSAFLMNCIGCKDCLGCINQRQQRFMILNEKLSEEEYRTRLRDLHLETRTGIVDFRRKADDFFRTQPHKAVQAEQNEKSSGNHLYNSKNSTECFDCKNLEDCRWCARIFNVKSSRDYTSWGDQSELMYQCAACGDHAYNLRFCSTCTTNNSNLLYCAHSTGSRDSFGCVGLRRKQYCIFNKQYTKGEYEALASRLIAHMKTTNEWGEYFPKDHSPFAYNETIAMEEFPLTKEEALRCGYRWKEPVDDTPHVEKIIPAEKLPEAITDIPDDILTWAIQCSKTKRPYRITKQELAYYRKHNIPVPIHHPDERHRRRLLRRTSNRLYERTCGKCGKEIQTTYAPERPELVYCEECYLKEVY